MAAFDEYHMICDCDRNITVDRMDNNTKLRFNSSDIANLGVIHRFNLIIENLSDEPLTIQIPNNILKRRIMLNNNDSIPVDISQYIYRTEIEKGEHHLPSLLNIKILSPTSDLLELESIYYEFDLDLFKHENQAILDKICIAKSYVDILQSRQHIESINFVTAESSQLSPWKIVTVAGIVIGSLYLFSRYLSK